MVFLTISYAPMCVALTVSFSFLREHSLLYQQILADRPYRNLVIHSFVAVALEC